ncbi:hypothetical protein [Nocardioides marmoriginsengisoli]|uniref:hypothetical protein n=1 Tax=Nocardioides marmoriginsengisoli TaxID=661483 RepID=UPI0011CE1CEE|nr:hypothetical protein [Nocardioides marmoriginsengisoli]
MSYSLFGIQLGVLVVVGVLVVRDNVELAALLMVGSLLVAVVAPPPPGAPDGSERSYRRLKGTVLGLRAVELAFALGSLVLAVAWGVSALDKDPDTALAYLAALLACVAMIARSWKVTFRAAVR